MCSANRIIPPLRESADSNDSPSSPEEQQIYDVVAVEETDSWHFNFRNNVRYLVKKDENQTLKGRLNYFLMNEELADVHFIVTDEDNKLTMKVPAHKFILAAGSCVFKAMFYGPLSNPGHNEIKLTDIDHIALANLLKFLYIDEADINPSNLVTTLYAAKKYQVMNLEKACVNYLSWSLSSDNVLLVLSQAILFDENQLVDLCWEKIEENIEDVVNAPSFELTDYKTLSLLLQRNGLALKEVDLYKACVRWAKSECKRQNIACLPPNLRRVLGDALYLIRFPTMTGDEFAFNVCDQNILHDDEVTSVFSYFAYPRQDPVDCKKFFESEPRAGPRKRHTYSPAKEIILSRFEKSAGGRFCMFDEVHKVDFIVNHPIYITGLGVYGTRCNKGERIIYIELRNSETSEILSTGHSKITCTGKPKIYQVRFRIPSLILPQTIYTASAEFDGSYPYPTYYGINGRRICSIDIPVNDGTDETNEDDTSWEDWYRDGDSRSSDSKKKKGGTRQISFVFFKSEKNNFLDTGGEQGQIPQIMFHDS